MATRTMTSEGGMAMLLLVLAMLGALVVLRPAPTEGEAWWLWVTRDVVTVEPAAPRDVLRALRDNMVSALDRSGGGLQLPVAAVLEGWTWLAGDSLEGLRWGGLLAVLIGAAVVSRLLRRISRMLAAGWLGALIVGAGLVWLISAPNPWPAAVRAYQAQRSPHQPALTTFSEASVAGYYHARHNLRAGLGIDLGWRTFSLEEMVGIVNRMSATQPIWLIGPTDSDATYLLITALAGRRAAEPQVVEGVTFWRFDPSTPAEQP